MKSLTFKLIVLIAFVFNSLTIVKATNIAKSPLSMTPPGNALAFDGVNDVVNVGNDAKLQLTQGTIEAWIKTSDAGSSYRGIVVKQMAYGLFMCNNELIAYEWGGRGNISSGVYLNDNKWHHVAFSFNVGVTNGSCLYVDGVKKATITFVMYNQSVGLGIGNGSIDTNIQQFNGQIDEARVWNVARTESEILSNMNKELTGSESGLVTYYNFNQGTAGGDNTSITSAIDRTSNGLNGTLSNFAKTGTSSNFVESAAFSTPGNCLSFDGSTNYISFGSSSVLNNLGVSGYTLEAWIYCTTASGVNSIIRKTGDYNLYINNGKLCAEVWQSGTGNAAMKYINGINNVPTNKWIHVAATWDGSVGTLYVNGNVEPSNLSSGNVPNSENLFIGKSSIYSQFFNGKIDEVRLWNTSRSQSTIQDNMYNKVSAGSSNLVGYWNFDANSGTTLADLTSNGNNGTLVNSPGWTESYAMVVPVPAAATNITDVSFTANWSAPTLGVVESYKLDVSTSSNFSSFVTGYSGLDCGTNLSQTVSGLAPNTTYYYRVLANKTSVTGTSGYYRTTATAKTLVDSGEFGNESWIGYVYTNPGANYNSPSFENAIYKGTITEDANFNRDWAGNGPTVNGTMYSEQFLVRFKMTKYLSTGRYQITLGGDDGVRLSVDGGSFIGSDWSIHGYRTNTVYLDVTQAGNKNFVYEFYENGGGAHVSFNCTKYCDYLNAPTSPVATITQEKNTISWDANGNPGTANYRWYIYDKANNYIQAGSGTNTSVDILNLQDNTEYYFKVQAENNCGGTAYATSEIFKTPKKILLSTSEFVKTSSTSISCGGNITYEGASAITARGVCWSTSPNPTIANNKTSDGTGTGTFTSVVNGLTASQIYYIRAYATNSVETRYGEEFVFITGINIQTDVVSDVTNTSATSGGVVDAENGIDITGKGVCWSTTTLPTIDNDHTVEGTGSGEFISQLTGLAGGTKYYVRAYATTNGVTFYGEEFNFTYYGKRYVAANGWAFDGHIFMENGTFNDQPYFTSQWGSSLYFDGGLWWLDGWIESYESGSPALSGYWDGTVLTVVETPIPLVTFNKNSLKESSFNDGKINETLTITHDNTGGATFTGTNNENFVETGKAVVRNLPAGLTARIIRKDDLTLTLSITGSASAHAKTDDVSNIKIMLKPSAFTDGNTVTTKGNLTVIAIHFIDPVDLTVTGTKSCAEVGMTADNNVILACNSTLNIGGQREMNQLTMQAGSKLNVSNSVTVNDIILKADDSNSFSAKLGSCMTVNGTLTFEKTMLDSKWYFLSFPCDVNVNEISMVGGGTLDTDFFILTYDGANRATHGDVNNWTHVTSGTLSAKKGYAYGLKTGLGTKTLSFVLNKTIAECETDATVPATFYDGSLGNNHKGWNLIGQPYLSKFAGADVGINYLTTWNGSGYTGRAKNLVECLNPFEAFFVQVGSSGPISFALSGRQAVRSIVHQNTQESLQLNFSNSSGTDFSTLIFDNTLSSGYEIGQDLEKWINTSAAKPQIYTVLNTIKYAYNALPIADATNMPLGYFSKSGGASTISASNINVTGLSGLLLVDNKTGATTDLMTESYSFTADAGTNNSRFSIIPQRVSTATENQLINSTPNVRIVNSKLVITNIPERASVGVFDISGKCIYICKTVNSNTFEFGLNNVGIYTVRIISEKGNHNYKVISN